MYLTVSVCLPTVALVSTVISGLVLIMVYTMRAGRRFLVVPRFLTGSGRAPRHIRQRRLTERPRRRVLLVQSVHQLGSVSRTEYSHCSLDRSEMSSDASRAVEPEYVDN